MKQHLSCITLALLISCGASFAAEQTWSGEITSSMCTSGHAMGHDCILNCIKAGEKYVFVTKGQVRKINNQDFSDLEKHAGHTVKLTGNFSSDGKTITVTKVAMMAGAKQ